MRIRRRRSAPGGLLLASALLVLTGAVAATQPGPEPTATAKAAPTPTPAATPPAGETKAPAGETTATESLCANCHDQAKTFNGNPHARRFLHTPNAGPDAACISCHGDGNKHAEEGGDKSLIRVLRGPEGAKFCLTCHGKATDHSSFGAGSIHANSATVNCLTCHSIHHPAQATQKLLVKMPGELCQSCHGSQAAQLRSKPYTHRLDRGGMTCLDCHNPHGRPTEKGLNVTRAGELPCLNCHTEKRGPFVFSHVDGIAGNCLSCHQPHGSSNPKMLQWARVDQLCLSCHSRVGNAATIGSQPPSIHDLTLPRYRNCTTCHVAVHGSNLSPTFFK